MAADFAYARPAVNEDAARRLCAPVALPAGSYSLVQAAGMIQRQTGVPVRFQWDGLAALGINADRTINFEKGAVPADRLLATLLLDLAPPGSPMDWEIYPTYLLVDGAVVIGTNRSLKPLAISVDWPEGGPRVIDASEAVRRQLSSQVITVERDSFSLQQSVEMLRETTGLSIQVDWQQLELVGIDQDSLVWGTAQSMRADDFLDVVLRQVSAEQFDGDKAGYCVKQGLLHITTRGEITEDTDTRVYNVRDLVSRPYGPLLEYLYTNDDFVREMLHDYELAWLFDLGGIKRVFDLNDALGNSDIASPQLFQEMQRTWSDVTHNRTEMLDQLSQLIQDTAGDVDDWLDERATLQEINGNFIIKANEATHDEIADLLDRLREARAEKVYRFMREVDVARLMKDAEALRVEGKYEAALEQAQAALAVDPASVPARALRDVIADTIARRDAGAE